MGGPFRHFGGAMVLFGHCLGAKWSQNHVDESAQSDLDSNRGGLRSHNVPGVNCGRIFNHCWRYVGMIFLSFLDGDQCSDSLRVKCLLLRLG